MGVAASTEAAAVFFRLGRERFDHRWFDCEWLIRNGGLRDYAEPDNRGGDAAGDARR